MFRFLGRAWRRWLKFAEILGNIQMTVFLSIIYWTLLLMIAIPFKLFSDPLSIKRERSSKWVSRRRDPDVLESMRRQG